MRKNIDILACMPKYGSSWTFYVAGKAYKISGEVDEILDITKKVLEINEGFFIPKNINYAILTYSDDYSVYDAFKHKHIKSIERNLESKNKVSFLELDKDVKNIKAQDGSVRSISRISIDGKTKFVLKGKEEYIDSNSPRDLYAYFDFEGNIDYDKPKYDPFRIQIFHDNLKGENKLTVSGDPAYYTIVFWTETDMWFEKTDIGLTNRNNLRSVIKKLYNNFNVSGTFFMSDWFSKEDLKDVVFGND